MPDTALYPISWYHVSFPIIVFLAEYLIMQGDALCLLQDQYGAGGLHLHEGQKVVRGPDWKWGNQDGNEEV